MKQMDKSYDISPLEFLQAIFPEVSENETPIICRQKEVQDAKTGKKKGVFINSLPNPRVLNQIPRAKRAFYYCVSTVKRQEELRRRKEDTRTAYVVVLDDIGTKVAEPSVPPTYVIESSEGNYQYGYRINPEANLDLYEAAIYTLADHNITDSGSTGRMRVMRLPGSLNIKPAANGWRSVVRVWEPDLVYDLKVLVYELTGSDVDINRKRPARDRTKPTGSGAGIDDYGDPLLRWLYDRGMVLNIRDSEWLDIICPWNDGDPDIGYAGHTTGENWASYSPVGYGQSKTTRSFCCQHSHRKEHNTKKFVEWAEKEGYVEWAKKLGFNEYSAKNPLAAYLTGHFAVLIDGPKFALLRDRDRFDKWYFSATELSSLVRNKTVKTGEDNYKKATTFLTSSYAAAQVRETLFDPSTENIVIGDFYNTYEPPHHDATESEPLYTLEHIRFLLPKDDEFEYFLNWLAFKVQNPASRSCAVVMVANAETQGLGRGWLGSVLMRMWKRYAKSPQLKDILGLDSQAQYTEWANDSLFCLIQETKEPSLTDSHVKYNAYERLKMLFDTSPVENFRTSTKYGMIKDVTLYMNFLMFSNYINALVIPEEDRRVVVLENPSKGKPKEYYKELYTGVNRNEEARRLWHWLKRRDVSEFDNAELFETPARLQMIDNSKSRGERMVEDVLEMLPGRIIPNIGFLREAVHMESSRQQLQPDKGIDAVVDIFWDKLSVIDPNNPRKQIRINGRPERPRIVRDVEKVRNMTSDEIHKEINKNLKNGLDGPAAVLSMVMSKDADEEA